MKNLNLSLIRGLIHWAGAVCSLAEANKACSKKWKQELAALRAAVDEAIEEFGVEPKRHDPMRRVEYYRLWGGDSGTWDTDFMAVPCRLNTDAEIEAYVRQQAYKLPGKQPIAVGLYHYSEDEESFGECARCGSNLRECGLCTDVTCPFHDHLQACGCGWLGHPEVPAGVDTLTCMCERFTNYYRCSECGEEWDSTWSCTCNDRCPECGTETEPLASTDALSNELPFGGGHAPCCPYRCHGECDCWRSDPKQNPELADEERAPVPGDTVRMLKALDVGLTTLNIGQAGELLRVNPKTYDISFHTGKKHGVIVAWDKSREGELFTIEPED